ncbi:MAG TPA: hypothetical protein VEZ88_07575 [Steroidobacteraceae bacterium]|nr:hypothetical protein [Steroidobacteraceae bacterium]
MTTQGCLARRAGSVSAVILALAPVIAHGGTIAGRIVFPGRDVPDAMIYAHNLDTQAQYQQPVRRGEARFSLDLPAGRYWIFVRPEEPGLAGLYGAHTQFTVCRHTTAAEATCTDHGLATVELEAQAELNSVDIDDWMLPDEAVSELDRILGGAPKSDDGAELGRPRFSEYRVPAATLAATVSVNPGSDAHAAELEQLASAAREGHNFAGGFALTRLSCGVDCDAVAIIDLRNGLVAFPEQLAHVSGSLPCRAGGGIAFRDDSRLLEYTRREGESAVTDYLLWDTGQRSFSVIAQYRRSLARFCAAPAATP